MRLLSGAGPSVRVVSVVVLMCTALPLVALAQARASSRTGVYVGGSIGGYLEAWEGMSGSAAVRAVIIGFDFSRRWGIRSEVGSTGDVCDRRSGSCHRDRPITVSLVRRFGAGTSSFYLLFGPWAPHAGLGVEIPIGERLLVSPEFDVVYTFYAIAARPKLVVALRL